jgi:glucosamine-6-phosphate deaminase
MRVIIRKTYDEISAEAAMLIRARMLRKKNFVLGLATGSSPLGLYRELIRLHRQEGLSFKNVITFNLDEYYGIGPGHPQSYRYFMNENLFNHIDIKKSATHVPDGLAKDFEKFCRGYENAIKKAGGIDLQVLGIGSDGHIGFNEPGSAFTSRTRLIALDEQTIADNARFFSKKEDVPRFAISMGVGTILEARELILIANGTKKADIIARTLEGPVTSLISATAIHFHPRVTVFLDEDAASKLQRVGYYRFAEESEKAIGKEIF